MEIPFTSIGVDRSSSQPLYRQLYDQLRDAILSGRLPSGTRLPSTRAMAQQLGLSRNTVMSVFDQLQSEGFLEGQVGSGTRVARNLPAQLPQSSPSVAPLRMGGAMDILSRRGRVLATRGRFAGSGGRSGAFTLGTPALDRFPIDVWTKLTVRKLRGTGTALMGYVNPAGYYPLREAIAGYVAASRGLVCAPEQVIVVSGAQQALDIAARVLLNAGDMAWMEEPGYFGAHAALLGNGVRLTPVPVDQNGFDVEEGQRRGPARLAYVTPSHQFPLGYAMSLQRRLALLDWAAHASGWIIEDDNDSEYRYDGHPVPTLFGLDTHGVVIHTGTFAKTMFPALRIGYLIVPSDLIDAFASARAVAGWCSPAIEQAVLADFIVEGHLARHIRRMRTLYAERRALLASAWKRVVGDAVPLSTQSVGMHAVAWLPEGVSDLECQRGAAERDVALVPLSACCLVPHTRGGLILGYACTPKGEIDRGVLALSEEVRSRGITLRG